MSLEKSFNTQKYYDAQVAAFSERMKLGEQQVIEFGGKPFGDYHASRVLPGYHPDIKAEILQEIHAKLGNAVITMAVNARDILQQPDGRRIQQRIRGDSGLRYDLEAIRLVNQSRSEFELPIDSVTLTSVPEKLSAENENYLEEYTLTLKQYDLDVRQIGQIEGYPHLDTSTIVEVLTQFDSVAEKKDHLIIVSPGGGSGKFGVAATEIAHKLFAGHNPNFIKFETFPVFNLAQTHPLNAAFLAATADLPNDLSITNTGKTNYVKDDENLAILKSLVRHFPHIDSPLRNFNEPTDMGVNVIELGIEDDEAVKAACIEEIRRRVSRYASEVENGDEIIGTLTRTAGYLAKSLSDNKLA